MGTTEGKNRNFLEEDKCYLGRLVNWKKKVIIEGKNRNF